MRARPRLVWLLLGVAYCGLVAAALALPAERWLGAAVFIPLVTLIPGGALTYALVPPPRLPALERLIYAVALSVTIAALSGVLALLVLDLDRLAWGVILLCITAAAGIVALARGAPRFGAWPWGESTIGPALWPLSMVVLAVLTAALAVVVSSTGARDLRNKERFVELWIEPARGGAGHRAAISVGVGNEQGGPRSYALTVSRGRSVLGSWRLRLPAGATWHRSLALPSRSPDASVEASLVGNGEVLRRVHLSQPIVRN